MLIKKRNGFILIFASWVLAFLTILAVGLASGIRQKIVLVEKLDQRSRNVHLLETAVKYSANYVVNQINNSGQLYNTALKMSLHNNPETFGGFNLGLDNVSVSYIASDQREYFGVVDEERKINLNVTTTYVLQRLIEKVLSEKPDTAIQVAEAILDWRQFGESQVKGFFSDAYYDNLEYPYPKKDANYEVLDELLLIKGMTKEKFKRLLEYVTIYGDGKVNINTAPPEVLYALGLEDVLIEKILEVRQGRDKVEATVDDHVFVRTFDIATEINGIIKLQADEIHAIEALNQQNLLATSSYYFSVNAHAHLANSSFAKNVHAIFSSRENKIVYWKER